MLRRLFSAKTRDVTDPIESLWVRYFTAPPPLNETELSSFPRLSSFLHALPEYAWREQSIHQRFEVPTAVFLVEFFGLDTVPDEPLQNLIDYVATDFYTLRQSESVLEFLIPFIFQFSIKWIRGFLPRFNQILESRTADDSACLSRTQSLFELCDRLPTAFRSDVLLLWSPVFLRMATGLKEQAEGLGLDCVISFLSSMVQIATSDKGFAVELSEIDLPVVTFAVADYLYWSVRMSEPTLSLNQLQDCFFVIKFLMNAPVGFALKFSDVMIEPIIPAGFNVLSLAFMSSQSSHDIFLLCNVFVEFLRFVTSIPELAPLVWKHPMLHFISFFATWVVDRFPILSFARSNAFDEDERSLFQTPVGPYKGRFEFITVVTFPPKAVECAPFRPLSEDELFKQFSFGALRDTIASNKIVSRLLTTLISLSKNRGGETFVQIFLDNALTFINPYEDHQIPLISETWKIASSICLVTLFYLNSLPTDLILLARPKLSGFISSYVFTRDAVWWSGSSKAEDFQFFKHIRAALFGFFAREFKADLVIARELFDAIAEFWDQGKPQVVSDVLQFVIALFRYDSARFMQVFPDSQLLRALVGLAVRLRQWHVELVRDQKDRFIPRMRKCRVTILGLLFLLLEVPATKFCVLKQQIVMEWLFHILY
jgi:hypothetical protein